MEKKTPKQVDKNKMRIINTGLMNSRPATKKPTRPPISAAEKQIGARLRQFRSGLGLTRAALARAIGCTMEALATYEAGRVFLPWGVYVKLSDSILSLSAEWLATGEGSRMMPLHFLKPVLPGWIDPQSRFSTIYEKILAPVFEATYKDLLPSAVETLRAFLRDADAGKLKPSAVLEIAREIERVRGVRKPLRIGGPRE